MFLTNALLTVRLAHFLHWRIVAGVRAPRVSMPVHLLLSNGNL